MGIFTKTGAKNGFSDVAKLKKSKQKNIFVFTLISP